MPIDYALLDAGKFSFYCKRKNALLAFNKLLNMSLLRYCLHVIPYCKM